MAWKLRRKFKERNNFNKNRLRKSQLLTLSLSLSYSLISFISLSLAPLLSTVDYEYSRTGNSLPFLAWYLTLSISFRSRDSSAFASSLHTSGSINFLGEGRTADLIVSSRSCIWPDRLVQRLIYAHDTQYKRSVLRSEGASWYQRSHLHCSLQPP